VKGFTEQTASLLESLEAIDHIDRDAGRIYYSEEFMSHVISSWHGGDSPTALFRKAGLGPEIIDSKRIERCVARWRDRHRITDLQADEVAESLVPMSLFLAQTERLNALESRIRQLEDEQGRQA
jgi:hypothetical protein